MKGKKVLVTGADGFIGSHLVEKLVDEGANVKALVQYNSFASWGWLDTVDKSILNNVEVVLGDVRDPHFCISLCKNVDLVFHLAALIAIPHSYVSVQDYLATNTLGTQNLLEAAKMHGVQRFVHTSTSEVYGSAQYVPINEEHPLNAQSPYAATKIAADQLALSYYSSFNTPVVIARPFNTYGPRQSARAIIPTIITQALTQKNAVIKLGALHPTRDFNYVADTVHGFICAATASDVEGRVFNLGSGFEATISLVVDFVSEILNKEIIVESDTNRMRPDKSEVDRLLAESKLAKEKLSWLGEYHGMDGLKRGLNNTIDWFKQEKNLCFYKSQIYNT